ncbi:hypothetical protein CWE22_00005, partial [Pseudidiomarina aestuarii]
DSIPNSDVKRFSADGSVGSPHVRVGHRQASNKQTSAQWAGVFYFQSDEGVLLSSRAKQGIRKPNSLGFRLRSGTSSASPWQTARLQINKPQPNGLGFFYVRCAHTLLATSY